MHQLTLSSAVCSGNWKHIISNWNRELQWSSIQNHATHNTTYRLQTGHYKYHFEQLPFRINRMRKCHGHSYFSAFNQIPLSPILTPIVYGIASFFYTAVISVDSQKVTLPSQSIFWSRAHSWCPVSPVALFSELLREGWENDTVLHMHENLSSNPKNPPKARCIHL